MMTDVETQMLPKNSAEHDEKSQKKETAVSLQNDDDTQTDMVVGSFESMSIRDSDASSDLQDSPRPPRRKFSLPTSLADRVILHHEIPLVAKPELNIVREVGELLVIIPEEHVGRIIGKGGLTIKDLQDRSGARIFMPKENVQNESYRVSVVTGLPPHVYHCYLLMHIKVTPRSESARLSLLNQELTQYFTPSPLRQHPSKMAVGSRLSIPSEYASTVLQHQTHLTEYVLKSFAVNVEFHREISENENVHVTAVFRGPSQQVEAARRHVQSHYAPPSPSSSSLSSSSSHHGSPSLQRHVSTTSLHSSPSTHIHLTYDTPFFPPSRLPQTLIHLLYDSSVLHIPIPSSSLFKLFGGTNSSMLSDMESRGCALYLHDAENGAVELLVCGGLDQRDYCLNFVQSQTGVQGLAYTMDYPATPFAPPEYAPPFVATLPMYSTHHVDPVYVVPSYPSLVPVPMAVPMVDPAFFYTYPPSPPILRQDRA